MNIKIHEQEGNKIAEVIADHILITNAEDGLQILVDLYYQDFDAINQSQADVYTLMAKSLLFQLLF